MLEVKGLSVKYGPLTLVDNVSFTLKENQWLMIAGPNGAGKSTIINAVSQGAPYTGSVTIRGKDARKLRPQESAKHIGVLSQTNAVGYSFTVGEIIRMGRYAYRRGIFSPDNTADDSSMERAIDITGLRPLLGQSALTLSGGELQRTFLAQLFAQDPDILLLDEPTNHLDPVYQKQTFTLLREWLKAPGKAILSVVHDLSLAKAYGTHALLLDGGKTVAYGGINDVLGAENLRQVYSMDVHEWMRTLLGQWK